MKNIHFTRLIRIRGLLREVNFRRLPGAAGTYHVDLTDERGNRFVCTLNKEAEGFWKLSNPVLPDWIREAEGVLAAALEEGQAQEEEGTNWATYSSPSSAKEKYPSEERIR